jgi:hypothetical protein
MGHESAAQRRARMVRCGFAVLRALANSDLNKVKMGEGATLGVLLQALENLIAAPSVVEQVCGVLSNICLRLPAIAQRVVDRGGLPLLARAMRTHAGHAALQRSACLALRNVVVKDRARAQAALDEGFEQLLQQCYMRHSSAHDVSYACLRDLGVDVETSIGVAQAERAARAIAAGSVYVACDGGGGGMRCNALGPQCGSALFSSSCVAATMNLRQPPCLTMTAPA